MPTHKVEYILEHWTNLQSWQDTICIAMPLATSR